MLRRGPERLACIVGLASAAIVTSARPAHALGPIDVEVGAKGGVGGEYSGGLNPLGFGVGGRAGAVLPTRKIMTFDHVYVGLSLMYYFGTSEMESSPAFAFGNYTQSIHTLMYGGEVGLGFKPLDSVTIRPQFGLGNATFGYAPPPSTFTSGATTYVNIDESSNHTLYVEPGVTVLVALGTLFVGADASVLLFPGFEEDSSRFFITLHGQVGVKF